MAQPLPTAPAFWIKPAASTAQRILTALGVGRGTRNRGHGSRDIYIYNLY